MILYDIILYCIIIYYNMQVVSPVNKHCTIYNSDDPPSTAWVTYHCRSCGSCGPPPSWEATLRAQANDLPHDLWFLMFVLSIRTTEALSATQPHPFFLPASPKDAGAVVRGRSTHYATSATESSMLWDHRTQAPFWFLTLPISPRHLAVLNVPRRVSPRPLAVAWSWYTRC